MLRNLSNQSDYDNKISVTEWQSNPKDSDYINLLTVYKITKELTEQ